MEFEHDTITITVPSIDIGQPTFNSFPDFLIGRCGNVSGCALSNGAAASNEQSPGGSTTLRANNGLLEQAFPSIAVYAYVQDDYKVSSRLTLNLGLRWEYDGITKAIGGGWSGAWPSLIAQQPIPGTSVATGTLVGFMVPSNFTGPIPAGVTRDNQSTVQRSSMPLDLFAPRVGFAWQPLTGNRLVVRGGAGYFYDRPNGQYTSLAGLSTPPFAITVAQNNLETLTTPFIVPPTTPGPAGTPGWTPRWVTPTGASSTLAGRVLAENYRPGTVYEWNLNTQYEFLPTWVLELGYVGSRGIHETAGIAFNNGSSGGNNPPINTANLASPNNPLSCGYDGVPTDCITTIQLGTWLCACPISGSRRCLLPAPLPLRPSSTASR